MTWTLVTCLSLQAFNWHLLHWITLPEGWCQTPLGAHSRLANTTQQCGAIVCTKPCQPFLVMGPHGPLCPGLLLPTDTKGISSNFRSQSLTKKLMIWFQVKPLASHLNHLRIQFKNNQSLGRAWIWLFFRAPRRIYCAPRVMHACPTEANSKQMQGKIEHKHRVLQITSLSTWVQAW